MKKKKEKLNIDKTNVAKLTGMNKIRGGGDPSHNTSLICYVKGIRV